MLEYCALPHLRPFYPEVALYTRDVEWYLRRVEWRCDPNVSYPTQQEVVQGCSCGYSQAVILRDGSVRVKWHPDGDWKDYSSGSPAVHVDLEYPTAKVEYNNGEEAMFFLSDRY